MPPLADAKSEIGEKRQVKVMQDQNVVLMKENNSIFAQHNPKAAGKFNQQEF